ncbi:MAG: hypothetical protein ACK4JB_26205 [Reyranella sp.]
MSDLVRSHAQPRSRRMDRIEFRLLMLLSFPIFLFVACASRLMRDRTALAAGRRGGSVFAEARTAAASAIPFAFMG